LGVSEGALDGVVDGTSDEKSEGESDGVSDSKVLLVTKTSKSSTGVDEGGAVSEDGRVNSTLSPVT
jgi:hypothetical protein